jgi:hypothetical protein
VTSLEAINGTVYAANGYLFARAGGAGDWKPIDFPEGSLRCSEIASDGTSLYARFTTTDYSTFNSVQRYNGNSWTKVSGLDDVALIGSGNGRIYAFAETDGAYSAYVTAGAGSDAFGAAAIGTGLAVPTGTAGDYVSTSAAVYAYSAGALSEAGGNGSSPSGVTGITVNENALYALNTSYAYRYDGTAWTSIAHDLSSPTSGIAYLGGSSGKNLLLIASKASDGGYSEVVLNSDGTLASVIDEPGDSDESSISSTEQDQYESSLAQWAIYRIFAIASPIPDGNDYVIYASVINKTYHGLWSFYSGTRREWNRE